MTLQLYDHLLRFQLFQGLSRGELLQMAGNTKFGFRKEESGATVVREGDDCRQLLFLVSGAMQLTTHSEDGTYRLVERLAAPWLLQPDVLFGITPRYSGTYITLEPCHFITLSKDEVLRLTDDFLIIRLNLMNMLSTMAQKRNRQPWRRVPTTLDERFVRFVMDHSIYPAGTKTLHILMTHLAANLNDSRLNISRMLNRLQAHGLIELHRGSIVIPSLEKLATLH
jgi:CRP-like cAMP-binding protein